MAEFNFTGGTYQASSPVADAERCINFMVETIEGTGKAANFLVRTPGTQLYTLLSGLSVPAQLVAQGRWFAVSGVNFYEIFADKTSKIWNPLLPLANDGTQVYLAASNTQLLIVSGGAAYSLNLSTGVFASILIDSTNANAIQGPVSQCDYSDGFFFVLLRNSAKFQISAVLNDTSWSALDVAQISVFPENIVGMKVDHREPWFWGSKQSQVYGDSGNPLFPFEAIGGAFIENGLAAADSPCKLDNTVFWLGADERGNGIAWRAQGYNGVRISNHAIESRWRTYTTIADAISYSYQERGHTCWVLQFPTANVTWVYDVSTGFWYEWQSWDGGAHHSRSHVLFNGKHYIGDSVSGAIYEMSFAFLSDQDHTGKVQTITRQRVSPYIADEDRWMYFNKLEFSVNTGMATLLDGQGNPRPAQIMLDWSDDAARTWSNGRTLSVGLLGAYPQRVIARRLGRIWGTMGRAIRVTVSDPVDWAFINAYVNAPPDIGPHRRLASQLSDQA